MNKHKKDFQAYTHFKSDVSDSKAIPLFFDAVIKSFPKLNVLINNAGIMRNINFPDQRHTLDDISREIETNLTGTVRMVAQFLPHLKEQDAAAIVNVSSGLAFVPLPIAPVYCAAKAGVHSFTQSLRVQLKNTKIRVFELAPPMTRTPLFAREIRADDVKGIRMMDAAKMVSQAINGVRGRSIRDSPGTEQRFEVNEPCRTAAHFEAAQPHAMEKLGMFCVNNLAAVGHL